MFQTHLEKASTPFFFIKHIMYDSPQQLKSNSDFLKPRPYFLFEIRLSTHREQFGEDRHPLRAI